MWRKPWQFHSITDWVNFLTKKTNSALWSTNGPSSAPADTTDSMHLVRELEPEPNKTHPCRDIACSGNLLLRKKNRIFSLHWGNNHDRICRDSFLPVCHPSSISMREHFFCTHHPILFIWKGILKKKDSKYLKIWKLCFCFPLHPSSLLSNDIPNNMLLSAVKVILPSYACIIFAISKNVTNAIILERNKPSLLAEAERIIKYDLY